MNTNVKGSIVPKFACMNSELLKMEAVSSSETFVSGYKSTRHYNPKD
jgi:hypothetical protein